MKRKENILNVRLDEDTEKKLSEYSSQMNTTKSSVVKEALAMYFTKEESKQLPFALGQDLFGAASSGSSDTSTTYKSKLKDKLREKHTH
jgi:predicted DNA-binding protein